MASKSFRCQLKAETSKKDEAELLIYDEIGKSFWGEGVDAKTVVQDLAGVTAKKLRVRINSGGGDVFEGLAIHNALLNYDGKVITEIDALGASIASIVFLAGEERRMADNAFLMIHNPVGFEYGDASAMREMADLLDKVGGGLANIYAEHSDKDLDEIRALMDAETWFTAEEAKEAGFVTAITKGKKVEARADLSAFARVPEALKLRAEAIEPPPAETPETPEPTADGDAAPDETTVPNQPAPVANGATPMSDQDKATLLATERARVKSIRAIGQEHKIEQALVDTAIDDETTVDAFRAVALEQIKARHAAAPQINARVGAPRADKDPARGFESHRDFCLAVIDNAGIRDKADVDERLRPLALMDKDDKQAKGELAYLLPRAFNPGSIRAAAGSDEQGTYSDPYGGFAVPTTTLPGLLSVPFEGDPTAGRTQAVPMASPMVKLNARTDKDHTSSVSGGFTVSRRAETAGQTASRMEMEQIELKAHSLFGLAYATEEILQDSPISFAALIASGFSDQFPAHILNEKIRGLGGNQYVGITSAAAGCKVEVSKETGQAADTIVATNVIKMAARCWGFGNSIWIANHDTRPQLAVLSIAVGTGGVLIYQPSEREGFPDMLWGRPVFYTEYASTVGDAGDLILWNPTQYLEGLYQPLQSAESVHVRFENHERVFKFWVRNCGAPWWRSALTPAKGSNTLSPIVTLAARA